MLPQQTKKENVVFLFFDKGFGVCIFHASLIYDPEITNNLFYLYVHFDEGLLYYERKDITGICSAREMWDEAKDSGGLRKKFLKMGKDHVYDLIRFTSISNICLFNISEPRVYLLTSPLYFYVVCIIFFLFPFFVSRIKVF